MGFMQKLRQNMPAVVIFLAIMFVALIVFEWGDAKRGRGTVVRGGGEIGEVNGQLISQAEYEARVEQVIAAQRQQNPDQEIDDQRIRDLVWHQMVNEALVQQEADRLGISISDEELREVLLYDPPAQLKQSFTDSTGVFQQAIYLEFMRDVEGFLRQRQATPEDIAKTKAQLVQMQEDIRRDRLRQAVESAVTASAIPTLADLRTTFMEQRTKASGTFALLPVSTIPDDNVKVSDQEARDYFDKHRSEFTQKANREVRYVLFPLEPSAQDSATIRRRLGQVTEGLARAKDVRAKDSIFAQFVDQFGAGRYNGSTYTPLQEMSPELQNAVQGASSGDIIGPVRMSDGTYLIDVVDVKDSGEAYVKAQHILLRTQGASDDSVKALAQKILQRAKGGESFEKLATEFSGDPGSAQKGGDVGYFKRGMMVKPFEDAAFAAAPGSIVGPVKTEYGYHIIKITDKTSRSYKLRDMKFDVRVSNTTKNLLRRKASLFHDQLAQGGSIDSLSAHQQPKLQVYESGPIQNNEPAAGSMRLTSFAFQGNQGDISDVIEMQDGSYLVAQLSKVRNPGTMEFADAKQTIIDRIRLRKKLDMLTSRAERMRASLQPGDSLSKLQGVEPTVQITPFADVTRTSPLPGVGSDYALASAIFTAASGQYPPAIRGERGYYVVRVDRRTQPTDQEFAAERQQFLQQVITQRRQGLFQEWIQKAREKAQITDLRNSSR